jgi:hypothetical protein
LWLLSCVGQHVIHGATMKTLFRVLFGIAVLAIAGLAVLVWMGRDYIDTYPFPGCATASAFAVVKRGIDESPTGRVRGIAIIAITDAKQVSKTNQELKCSATASLNDARDRPLSYRFYLRGDQVFMETKFE